MRLVTAAALSLLATVPASAQSPTSAQADVDPQVRLIHEQMLVLDTHLDTPARFDSGEWDFTDLHHYGWDLSQTDLPRMDLGGLDGGFFVIYTAQGELTPEGYASARDRALVRAAAIRRVIGENRDRMGLALTADDAERLHSEGR